MISEYAKDQLRLLPSMTELLSHPEGQALCATFGEGVVKFEIRRLLDEIRLRIREENATAPTIASLLHALIPRLYHLSTPEGRVAINATGILLHTGLGRSPLAPSAIEALRAASGYTPLQASLDTGTRNLREEKVEAILRELTGCEAATVVNNNAAATMLILHTMGNGGEVVISRGQLIEIGGSYRMTEVMAMSGCILREVGCTNRTHLRDYEAAINPSTRALLHVHTSNYRIRGFANTPSIRDLVPLAHRYNLLAIDDLGSGALVPLTRWGLPDEPLVRDSIAAGVDVCCFSGDKLIGGPQAGLICGRKNVIERLRKSPYARMFRVCKLTLAALEATLLHFLNGTAVEAIPLYRFLSRPLDELEEVAHALMERLRSAIPRLTLRLLPSEAYIGSGSVPDQAIPSRAVEIHTAILPPSTLAQRLREGVPSIFGRVQEDALLLDLRAVSLNEAATMADRLCAILREAGEGGG